MAKKNSFGSIKRIKGREGLWFVKRRGGRSFTRLAGQTEAAAERFRSRVWVLCQEGYGIEDALAYVTGEPPPGSSRTTFAALAKQYEKEIEVEERKRATTLSCERYMVALLQEEGWANAPAEVLDRGEVRAWVQRRIRDGARPSTVNNQLSCFSAILKYAQDSGWIDDDIENPFLRCRLRRRYQKKRPGCDLDEFRHLLAASVGLIPEEPRRLLLAGGLVGWRLGDFANLRRGSVDLAHTLKGEAAPCMRVRPEDEKTSARKVAFLAGPMLAEMQGLLVSRKVRRLASAPVFTQPNGSTWHDPKRINRWLRKVLKAVPDEQIPAWKKWGDDAYLPFTFHSLRYTCRTIMVQLGISEHVIDAQLGHKSRYYTSMASHYTTVPESELLRAAGSMAAAFTDRPASVAPSVAP